MKKSLLLAAAAVLMGVGAGPAAAEGYLGVRYGNNDAGPSDLDIWQGEGAFGWASGNIGAQFGASVGNIDGGSADADFYALDGHVYFNGGGWRLGGLVAYASVDDVGEIEESAYGVEGMLDLGDSANVFARYTMGETDLGNLDTSNFEAGANFYITPNARIGAHANTGQVEDGPFNVDTKGYGVSGELQPWAAPLSLTLAWNQFEIVDTEIPESQTFSVGIRWNFGGGTLRARDNATPFHTATMLGQVYGVR